MKFIKSKSIDTILSTFTKTIAELDSFANSKFNESTIKSMQSIVLEAESETANNEGDKALEISQKLKSIIT